MFGALLERLIHLFKAPAGVCIKAMPTERNEQSGEDLALGKAYAICTQWLNGENMLAIKQAGYPQSSKPTQLTVKLGLQQ